MVKDEQASPHAETKLTRLEEKSDVEACLVMFESIMKGGTQGFPRHEVSDKQEVLFEDISPSTAFSIRQQ